MRFTESSRSTPMSKPALVPSILMVSSYISPSAQSTTQPWSALPAPPGSASTACTSVLPMK